ncbi:TlpA family protein disulfide reductase [Nocardia huaxiensis]|uniref:TlpA family protein disulfide reductase n=1 Tax=Nocardia huaxiensis TaxID=2755382 RepID=UPI001E2F75E1|nr:TlpA disulfide reductase family protein [Nocardia huaxiensis]UFS94910.1 TlpA family protein disulfide reductase [Nocardia huaxiensis]
MTPTLEQTGAPAPGGNTWWRWAVAAVVVAVAVAIVVWASVGGKDTEKAKGASTTPAVAAVSAADRAAAALAACPQPTGAPVSAESPLRGITLECLANGAPVDLAAALAGKPALINLWAYWCGPCAEELPLLQQYSEQVGDAVTVLTVHSDPATAKGLSRLTGLGIHLPGVADPDIKVRKAVRAPQVLPVSILVRADGTVAKVEVRAFSSVQDIADTMSSELGVKA